MLGRGALAQRGDRDVDRVGAFDAAERERDREHDAEGVPGETLHDHKQRDHDRGRDDKDDGVEKERDEPPEKACELVLRLFLRPVRVLEMAYQGRKAVDGKEERQIHRD